VSFWTTAKAYDGLAIMFNMCAWWRTLIQTGLVFALGDAYWDWVGTADFAYAVTAAVGPFGSIELYMAPMPRALVQLVAAFRAELLSQAASGFVAPIYAKFNAIVVHPTPPAFRRQSLALLVATPCARTTMPQTILVKY